MWALWAIPPALSGIVLILALVKGRVPSQLRWGEYDTREKEPLMFWSAIALLIFIILGLLLPLWDELHSAYPLTVPRCPMIPNST